MKISVERISHFRRLVRANNGYQAQYWCDQSARARNDFSCSSFFPSQFNGCQNNRQVNQSMAALARMANWLNPPEMENINTSEP